MWIVPWLIAIGIGLRLVAQFILAALNASCVRRNRSAVPAALRGMIEPDEYARSVDYSLAKNGFAKIEYVWDVIVLCLLLFTGVLPWMWEGWTGVAGRSAWAGAAFLVLTGLVFTLPGLPLEWWSQFRLEARFGFNKSTVGLWVADKLKGSAIAVVIGFPLLWLLLKLVDWLGNTWWLVGWAVFMGFQIVMIVVYPMWILPLFNKLTPLPEGDTRTRLMELARRAKFPAATIQVMDGSKRSTHSNAFFTGFGRFRRIVLFDTLIEQLTPEELEAVLAHEIGHYKLGHVPRMLLLSCLMTLAGFAVVGGLAQSSSFFQAFGFAEPSLPIAFLLVSLLAGILTFWFSPLANALSRHHEYQADAFARDIMRGPAPIVAALRKLSRKNLSNLSPHPIFSAFYYSHPTLVEREAAALGES